MRYTLAAALVFLAACGDQGSEPESVADRTYAETLQLQLIEAQPGDVIEIPSGTFAFDRGLSLTQNGVTIRGAGIEETVLTFKEQIAGAEGLLVTGDDFLIEDLSIEDAKGDALKINESDGVTIRRVRVAWTGGPKTENGSYGFYPVQTTNVLIEDSVAIGASDAGIYVGQSKNVVIRNNRAEENVAGIEVENTQDADVYGNKARNNTGGILVFNMPNLSQEGGRVRVFDNDVFENDLKNFAHPGTPVASIPAGSGVVVNSHDDVEIFGNRIRDNRTANVIISSVYASNYAEDSWSESFDPYPERIHLHGNELSGGGNRPDGLELKAAKMMVAGPTGSLPQVLWDGYAPEDRAPAICVEEDEAEVLNVDLPNGSKSIRVESEAFRCSLAPLEPVRIAGVEPRKG